MKRIEYIRQLPGLKEITSDEAACLCQYGLDEGSLPCPSKGFMCCDCEKCMSREATINGEPAPYLFPCPCWTGQKVYQPNRGDGRVYESVVDTIVFIEAGWLACCDSGFGFNTDAWMKLIFPTREAAERRMAEMRGKADGK